LAVRFLDVEEALYIAIALGVYLALLEIIDHVAFEDRLQRQVNGMRLRSGKIVRRASWS
jgi:hypothetical protein